MRLSFKMLPACVFFQEGCRPPLVLLLDRPAPLVLPHPARVSPLRLEVLPTVVTGLPLRSSSLVSLASHHWAPYHQAPLHLATAHPLVHHPHSRARLHQGPSLLVPRAQLAPLWLWLRPHTWLVPHQVDHRLPPTSTLRSFPHLATTACPPTTAEGPPDQTTHTDARHHMREGNMVLEAGRKIGLSVVVDGPRSSVAAVKQQVSKQLISTH